MTDYDYDDDRGADAQGDRHVAAVIAAGGFPGANWRTPGGEPWTCREPLRESTDCRPGLRQYGEPGALVRLADEPKVKRHTLQLELLTHLALTGAPATVVSAAAELGARSDVVRAALRVLEFKGFVMSEAQWMPPCEQVAFYTLTPTGRAALQRAA